ncbi:MAG: hypothetical protein WAL90_11695 [Desulfobacterales bacterium]
MARAGIHSFILVDLDTAECAYSLMRSWFAIPQNDDVALPPQCIFRVAVREVEFWIIADHELFFIDSTISCPTGKLPVFHGIA